jgi:dipeptidyl aminopeptidase/acylaminoacyl peptidase
MIRVPVSLAVAAVALAIGVAAAPAVAEERILYEPYHVSSYDDDHYPYIWSMRADGSDRRPVILYEDANSGDVAIAPDGRRFAFASTYPDGRGNHLFLAAPDGRHGRPLTADPKWTDTEPTWSPNGGTLAFVRAGRNGRRTDIYELTAAGQVIRRTTDGAEKSSPFYLPDGRLGYLRPAPRHDAPTPSPVVLDAADPAELPLPGVTTPDVPAWSPDGTVLAVVDHRPDGAHIMLRGPGQSSFTELLDAAGRPFLADVQGLDRSSRHAQPAWSPDGRVLLIPSTDKGLLVIDLAAVPPAHSFLPPGGEGSNFSYEGIDGVAWRSSVVPAGVLDSTTFKTTRDRTRPRLAIEPGTVRIGRRLPAVRKNENGGLSNHAIFLRLSEPAKVTIAFERRDHHRRKRVGPRLVLRKVPRWETNKFGLATYVRFAGRITRKSALTPGRYRLTAVAEDAFGNRSRIVHARMLLVR